ncbi:uncharacterized protein [Lolium perenne]|uniref:uncharacterized protein n=1 Tax=Lolium perenne TaxID=4522 RepID=UPI003A99F5A1
MSSGRYGLLDVLLSANRYLSFTDKLTGVAAAAVFPFGRRTRQTWIVVEERTPSAKSGGWRGGGELCPPCSLKRQRAHGGPYDGGPCDGDQTSGRRSEVELLTAAPARGRGGPSDGGRSGGWGWSCSQPPLRVVAADGGRRWSCSQRPLHMVAAAPPTARRAADGRRRWSCSRRLVEGADELVEGAGELVEGSGKLLQGAGELVQGCRRARAARIAARSWPDHARGADCVSCFRALIVGSLLG